MKVFISYKRENERIAQGVYDGLRRAGIPAYLDVRDPQISAASRQITRHIVNQLGNCTHILPIVTQVTVASWWVPFEIGVATEKEMPITTFAEPAVTLPQYLTDWPVIRSMADLEKFISLARTPDTIQRFSENYFTKSLAERETSARTFENTLKRLLNQ